MEKHKATASSLILDSFGFSNERLDKEILSYWPRRVPSHCVLGESRIHGIIQTSSCILGVVVRLLQPICLHAWNGPGEKPSNCLLMTFLNTLFCLEFFCITLFILLKQNTNMLNLGYICYTVIDKCLQTISW